MVKEKRFQAERQRFLWCSEKTSEQVKLLGEGQSPHMKDQPLSAQMLNHEPLYVFPVLLSGIVSFPVS